MPYTNVLVNGIDKASRRLRKLSGLAKNLPDELRAELEHGIEGVAREFRSLRARSRELERLASLSMLNPHPVVQVDTASGRMEFLNPAAERLFPPLRQSGAAQAWLQGLPEAVDGMQRTGSAYVTRKIKLGESWFEQDITAAKSSGKVRIYGRDITARHRAEAALEESEVRYRRLFESMSEGFALAEVPDAAEAGAREIRFLVVNPAFERLTDIKAGDAVGRPAGPTFPEAGPVAWAEGLERVIHTGEPVSFENWVDPHGRSLDVHIFPSGPAQFGVILNDVTERTRAERKLAASQADVLNEKSRLEAVLEALPVGLAIVDTKGGILQANRAYEELWGEPRPQTDSVEDYSAYRAWWAESGEPVRPDEWASLRAVRDGETIIGQKLRIERFDGAFAFALNSAAPFFDAEGRIAGSAVAIQDITDLVEAEASLQRARDELELRVKERTAELKRTLGALSAERQRFNDVLDMLPAYVALLTPDYRAPFVNRFFKERFGESGGRRCFEFLFGRTEACPDCETYKVLRTGQPHQWEWTGPDGRDYEVFDFPFADRDGSALILEMGLDITERRKAEEERMRLAKAVEQNPDGIAIMDVGGRVLSANPAFGDHRSLSAADLKGRSLRDLLETGVEDDQVVRRLREGLESGKPVAWRLKRRMPGGRVREFDLSISPVRDSSGRIVNSIAVERDVTQEAQLEERVRQWQKMEALGTLAGGIAHDFNNILLPIVINTELMLAAETSGSIESRRLSLVLQAARRGRDMVKQIIAFSRQKEQERRPVDVLTIVRETIKFLRVSIPRTIEIVEDMDMTAALALADPTQIQQVLMNLGSNAAHAMREKGGVLRIGLAETSIDEDAAAHNIGLKPGLYLRLSVSDTGHGMPPEVLARVFEPFFTTKKMGEGAGMGLAVAHGIVKNHGGAISVASGPGQGTTFTILLPRVVGTVPTPEEMANEVSGGTERILFVDDEEIQVRAMTNLLEHLGYRVVGTTSPLEALEEFRRQPGAFDLVIADQTMPQYTGGELVREMLAIRPGLPIILCTGYSDTLDEGKALAMGVRAFVMKPFSVQDIADCIRHVLKPVS